MYDDFNPLQLQQKAGQPALEFDTFDAALDEFYSKVPRRPVAMLRAATQHACSHAACL
jgi:hypothetical protein